MRVKHLSVGVSGRVQGVSFRWFTQTKAQELGITGWVKNETDGSVKIEAEGSKEALEQFITLIKEGPPAALVTKVDVREGVVKGYPQFRVLP
jgi:acylphosphatase